MTTTKIPVEFLNALSGSEITDGSIGTADIADDAITTAKIAANAITATELPDNVITATHIPNGLITGTHMAGTTITATQIANNAVGTDQLAGIARGKIIYGDSNGDPQLLALGSNGQVLKSDGSDIAWSSDVGETNRLPLAGGTLTGAVSSNSSITITNGSARFIANSTSSGDYVRMYGSGGTGKWDIYGNGANLRISDNESAGLVAIDTALTVGGTLGVTGVVTANAGVVVDNITIDGQEIDVSSGDLTLDVAGDIVLDTGGNNVWFDVAGTRYFSISNGSSDVYLGAEVQDKDIFFRGNDGGTAITALTLDMSDAGTATFNHDIKFASDAGGDIGATSGNRPNNIVLAGGLSVNAALGGAGTITTGGAVTVGGTLGVTGVTTIANTDSGQVNNESHVLIRNLANGNVITDDGLKMNCAENKLTVGGGTFITSGYIRSGAADMQFGTASQGVAITIDDTNKNVGIGEPTPIRRLVVNHPGGTSLHNGILLHADVDTANGTNGLYFKNDSTNTDTRIKAGIIFKRSDPGTRGTGSLHFCLERVNSDTNVATNHTMIYMGEDGTVQIGNPATGAATNFIIMPTAKLYLDAGGDTFIEEYSANEVGISTGGSRKFALSGGNLYHTGSINSNHNFSDERLKENIVVIPNALEKIQTLRGITFTRKDDGSVGTGLIAQELEKVLPEAVYESKTIESLENPDAEEYKAIRYEKTVGLLVEGIKELKTELEAAKERIKVLEG